MNLYEEIIIHLFIILIINLVIILIINLVIILVINLVIIHQKDTLLIMYIKFNKLELRGLQLKVES